MCIVLISTAHPDFPLILINNRDVHDLLKEPTACCTDAYQEFLNRPTAPAASWDHPNQHVIGGRDLEREVQGTWLGVTKDGRVAVLTNFREEGQVVQGKRSRGAMVNAFLCQPPDSALSTEDFVQHLLGDVGFQGVGGFSLVCGRIGKPLAVISNRTASAEGVAWVANKTGETVGLSNAAFGDRSWPKVVDGEKLLDALITRSINEKYTKERLTEELLNLLSTDTLPKYKAEDDFETFIEELRKSIFIPAIGGHATQNSNADEIASAKSRSSVSVSTPMSGAYGTQKQSVILVDHDGKVTFTERSLFDGKMESHVKDRVFQFNISSPSD